MMKINMNILTDQQQKALSRDCNLSVTAGAGTGKTLLLVERYIDILINEPVDVKDILAITFTKKAAAEMKDRVVRHIEEKITSKPPKNQYNKLVHARDRMNSASISTIHAFCARLLREFPVEAGLDPDFRQLNDMQRQLLLDEELEKEIESLDKDQSQWLPLFRLFGKEMLKKMLRTALEHSYEMIPVIESYAGKSVDEIYLSWMNSFLKTMKISITDKQVTDINICVKSILNAVPVDVQADIKIINTLELLQYYNEVVGKDDSAFWEALFNLADYFTTTSNRAYAKAGSFGSTKIWGVKTSEVLVRLSQKLEPVINCRISVPSEKDKEIIPQLQKFYLLYQRFTDRFSKRKNDLGLVDYDDLQLCALNLLQNHHEIRQKLSAQYRFIMVDEFQDTNYLQWHLISLLGELKSNKFFIVGDPKQSIYGFRNADIRVFHQVKNEFIKIADKQCDRSDIVLGESFRFAPVLGEFINRTFSNILHRSDTNPWEVGYDSMTSRRKTEVPGDINLAIFNDQVQTEFLAYKARKLSERYKFGQMAVLLRTRTHLSEIEEAFRKHSIPFRTIGGIGFYQRQEIYDIYYLIRFMLNPDDDNSLIALLRSPIAHISDEGLFILGSTKGQNSYWQYIDRLDERGQIPESDFKNLQRFKNLARNWLRRREHIAFHELLLSIFNDSNYRAILNSQLQGERFTANLDKILQIAVEFESTGFLSLSEFADSLQNLIHKQDKESEAQTDLDDENSVKIMTIHQAKGLEYDVVFIPYLEQELRNWSTNLSVFGENLGIAAPVRSVGLDMDFDSYYLLDLLKADKRARDLAEMKRLFYVACTRSKETLVLTMHAKKDKIPEDTAASWLIRAHDIDLQDVQEGGFVNNICISKSIPEAGEIDPAKKLPVWDNLNKMLEMVKSLKRKPERETFLQSVTDSPQGEIFSATQIMKHDRDPEEYKMRYHYGFFPDDYEIPVKFAGDQDQALLFGKVAHKYFEEYPEFNLDKLFNDLEITDPILRSQISGEIVNFQMLVKKSVKLESILNAKEYRNELSVMMIIGEDYLSGTLDRIYLNSEGLWEVVDYKTNKIKESEINRTFLEYKIQIEVYALLLSNIYPDQPYYPVSFYFTKLDRVKTHNFISEELESIMYNIQVKINEMKNYDPYISTQYDEVV